MSDHYRTIVGDALSELRKLPDESVHCCVTSPPYWQQRDYGVEGQIGLEIRLEAYIAAVTAVFHEVKRVLRADGTLWLNMGDTYATNRPIVGRIDFATKSQRIKHRPQPSYRRSKLKDKNLIGIPWRVAFALQADDWILRSDIIWHKSNSLPESVKDRPTKAHEYLFLFSKEPRYYYDIDAIREKQLPLHKRKKLAPWKGKLWRDSPRDDPQSLKPSQSYHPLGKNKRTVWSIPMRGYDGQHFSTFPLSLVEPCIVAGSPKNGVVLDPFLGSGTTAVVAKRLGRQAIGIELNPAYAMSADKRIASERTQ